MKDFNEEDREDQNENRYFDVLNRRSTPSDRTESAAPETSDDSASEPESGDSNPDSAQDGSYSYKGSEIPESRTQARAPEYEVSYNSSRREYSYSDGFATANPSDGVSPAPAKPKKRRTGWIVAGAALMLALSCSLGGVCGYLASSGKLAGNGNQNGTATGLSVDAIVDKHTAVLENPASNQESALTLAAKIAHDSVVNIDTYSSEEAERLGQVYGSGSGVIWTSDGYIVTCNHVVENAAVVKITLTDGKSYIAAVQGTDSRTDLAVLKINATESTLIPAVLRDDEQSPLILAETVLAIGNPLGVLGGTCTDGILSALERNIVVEGQSMTLLQTSASVNHGNSGGGLFDINGSLIGIVNAKSDGESVEGLGFAIPIGTVRKVANELITNGYVTGRPQLGIQVVSVTAENSGYIFAADAYPDLKNYATKSNGWGRYTLIPGAYLIDGSAVKYAEGSEQMKYGDLITYVGGKQISSSSDIVSALNDYSAGDTISVTVIREQSQTITVSIVLGQAGAST